MPLPAGSKIGSYQVVGLIGSGGMGEVYRATDTKLHRDVALKLLPAQFTSDHDRMERFRREAYVLASLNHTHIATIYGLEDSSQAQGLVMELVEGPTLADKVAHGPLPVEEILPVARQIAEALEYAHERGIVHRDLKPANIKVTPEGHVKVLDFGLAKAMSDDSHSAALSNSPTMSLAATQAGVILGTAAYMSPEQAKGKVVDRRSDIWSFGVVLVEMLTGKALYSGETVSETIAQVMIKEPDWSVLPTATPDRLRSLLQRCLVKDPRNRIRDIGDVRIAIEEIISKPNEESRAAPAHATPPSRISHWVPWSAAVVAVALGALAVGQLWRSGPVTEPVLRLTADLGVDGGLVTAAGPAVLLSPDGKMLVSLVGKNGQPPQIFIRRLDQLQSSPLPGTKGARNAFFSPDSQWIGFFADGKLKKVSVTGAAATTLCDVENDRGGTWLEDGSIVFAPGTRSGLFRVASEGGQPEALTKLDEAASEITHRWPYAGPAGTVLFIASAVSNNYEDANIVVRSIKTGEQKILHHGGFSPRYIKSGHLVYVQQDTMFAASLNANGLELSSQPVPILEGVRSAPNNGSSQFAFSDTGTAAYLSSFPAVVINWLGRDGKIQPLRSNIGGYISPRFSPDGKRIAFEMTDQQHDVWVYEWERETMTRLTLGLTQDSRPVWSPKGAHIAFASQRGDNATFNLYSVRADGTGEPQPLTQSKNVQVPDSWHPSGKYLAFTENTRAANDIMILQMEGDEQSGWKPGAPSVFLATPFNERQAMFSPDGNWLAYSSGESIQPEVYVQPFPAASGRRWKISTDGGDFASWSRNGKELFYRAPDQRIMVVSYKGEGDSFKAEKARLWSETPIGDRGPLNRNYDLHPDGQRVAFLKSLETEGEDKIDKATLIFNFFDELRR